MKCKMTEYGIELIPEDGFEEKCLTHLNRQYNIKVSFQNTWDEEGPLLIEGAPHPFDRKTRT